MTDLRHALHVVTGDAHRLWPHDRYGRSLPRRPVRGLRMDVTDPDGARSFVRHRVSASSRVRFAVSEFGGVRWERSPDAWEDWLWECVHQGDVTIHLPGCDLSLCHGCDGSEVGRPAARLRLVPRTARIVPEQ